MELKSFPVLLSLQSAVLQRADCWILSLQVKHKSDEESFNKLLSKLSSDIETMCAKHQDEKEALR